MNRMGPAALRVIEFCTHAFRLKIMTCMESMRPASCPRARRVLSPRNCRCFSKNVFKCANSAASRLQVGCEVSLGGYQTKRHGTKEQRSAGKVGYCHGAGKSLDVSSDILRTLQKLCYVELCRPARLPCVVVEIRFGTGFDARAQIVYIYIYIYTTPTQDNLQDAPKCFDHRKTSKTLIAAHIKHENPEPEWTSD